MWYYLGGKLVFCYLYSFQVFFFSIECYVSYFLYFWKKKKSYLSYRILEKQKKRASIQRHNNFFHLKEFKRFFIGGLCRLLLETENLDDLWFAKNYPSNI
jgi:hypothetical protein